MKKITFAIALGVMVCFFSCHVDAGTFVSGSTGADGAFNPPGQVPPGTIVDGNIVTVPLPINGIFNFTTLDVPNGITIRFLKNASNTPVYVLATGDVNIEGTINVSGEDGTSGYTGNIGPVPGGKGGPGGFDGGYGGEPESTGLPTVSQGIGLGPAGGCSSSAVGGGGGFGSKGGAAYCSNAVDTYGSYTLQPLIGGSGGGGGASQTISYLGRYYYGGGGGGGGGAILIAASGSINITGAVIANGGLGGTANNQQQGGDGSGGGIRLIANVINNSGSISAMSPRYPYSPYYYLFTAGVGRVRLEAYNYARGSISPAPSVTTPNAVFTTAIPVIAITKIAGVSVPSYVSGSYTAPDISLSSAITNPISIEIAAMNIPSGTQVRIDAVPQHGSPTSSTATLAGSDINSTAAASITISTECPTIITAQTTFTLQTAMYWEGEKIEKVRVASSVGKESKMVYITKSGREIPAEIMLAGLMK